jgi:hypothetical protein
MSKEIDFSKFKVGDIFHCYRRSIIGTLIFLFTKKKMKYSPKKITHTGVYLVSWGMPQIADSQKDGFNPRIFPKWLQKYRYGFIVTRKKEIASEEQICKKIMSIAGTTSYDYVSLFFRHPIRLIFGSWKNRKNDDKRMVCSESVAYIHDMPKNLSPIELFNLCIENDDEIIYQYK